MREAAKHKVGWRRRTPGSASTASSLCLGLLGAAVAVTTGACGKSSASSSTTAPPDGGTDGGGGGGAAPIAGSETVSGGKPQENVGAAPSDGGSADGAQPTTVLGGACSPRGALACAGSHQKLTLVCSAKSIWEVNQTCSAGEFCDSSSGPNLGVCATPPRECLDREPGALVCAADSLVKCGPDTLTTNLVEQCAHGCADGACSQIDCPALLFSCDPACQDSPSGCYDLCASVDAAAQPPLLDLADAKVGEEYRLALPVFSEAPKCACAVVSPALDAVAFRLPEPPSGLSWKIQASLPWKIGVNEYTYLAGTKYGNGCTEPSLGASCRVWPSEAIVWVGTLKVSPDPAQVIITLGATSTTHCD